MSKLQLFLGSWGESFLLPVLGIKVAVGHRVDRIVTPEEEPERREERRSCSQKRPLGVAKEAVCQQLSYIRLTVDFS